MKYNPNLHHRRSIRLKGYDYSQDGEYFITICTQNRECLFGNVVDEEMILNDAGKMAEQCWQEIPKHYPNVILDVFVIMPNHVHGILIIANDDVGAQNFVPNDVIFNGAAPNRAQNFVPLQRENKFQKIIPQSIGSIIRGYKIGVTKWFRSNTDIYTIWQRNYHEHIIRNEQSYEKIHNYIICNPQKWQDDIFFVN